MAEFQKFNAVISDDVYPILSLQSILAKRNVLGGVALEQTRAEIEALKKHLS